MSWITAPSLASLPIELMDMIISQLTYRPDLSSLSRTSKKIRAATVQSLFWDITMVWKGIDSVSQDQSQDQNQSQLRETPRIDLLLRTLLEQPIFADYVLKIDLQATGYQNLRLRGIKPQLSPTKPSLSYAARVKAALCRIGIDRTGIEEQMETGIMENDFNAVVAMVLLLCPRITSLILGLDFIIQNPLLPTIWEYALPTEISMQITRFQHLKYLKIGAIHNQIEEPVRYRVEWPTKYPDEIPDLHAYLPLFYISSLKHVEMGLPGLIREADFLWPTLSTPRLSSLSTLQLPECSISPKILYYILSSTPRLARLEYDCWLYYTSLFSTSALVAALRIIKDTLLHLRIKLQYWSHETVQPGDNEEGKWVSQSCSLRDLVSLRTLSISSCILLGWYHNSAPALADVLPPNLITARLQDDCGWYESFDWPEEHLILSFQAFFADPQWRTKTPQLQAIGVSYKHWADKDGFSQLCEQNGLISILDPSEVAF